LKVIVHADKRADVHEVAIRKFLSKHVVKVARFKVRLPEKTGQAEKVKRIRVQKPEAVRAAYIDEVKEGEAVKRIARVEGRKIVQAVLAKES
jgi:hypothetical protein